MAKALPVTNISDPRWVRAISHPVRIRLLALLEEEAASPVVLAQKLDQPLGNIAYHVRVLYDLGLLELVSTRQRRGATEHYYRAKVHPRFTDQAWAALDPVAKQRVLTGVLNESFEYAARSAAAGGFDATDAHFTRTPLTLDAAGWNKLAKATKRWLEEAARIERESTKRTTKHPDTAINAGLVLLLFEAAAVGTDDSSDGGTIDHRDDAAAHAQSTNGRQKAGPRRHRTSTAGP
jgi:DNA-binding transcriptional ArsR family regulator